MFRLTIAAATLAYFVVAVDVSNVGASHAVEPAARTTAIVCSRKHPSPEPRQRAQANLDSPRCVPVANR